MRWYRMGCRAVAAALIAVVALVTSGVATASDQDVPYANGWGWTRVAKSTTFTPTLADRGTVFDCTGTITVNLPSAPAMGSGYCLAVYNSGAGTVTVSAASGTIRTPSGTGATTTLAQGAGLVFECDATNYLAVAGGGGSPTGAASGDLSGTYPGPTVAKINGATLGSTTATSGNLLFGSGTAWVTHALSGDATVTSGGVLTLKNTGTAGTYAAVTTDAQGRVSSGAALSGDVTTSGAVATLASTAVSAGSYTNASITVDAKGRLTAASNGAGATSSLAVGVASASAFNTTSWATLLSSPVSGTLTIPANYFTVGKTLWIHLVGHVKSNAVATLNFRVVADASTAAGASTIGSADAPLFLDIFLSCTSTGAGGTMEVTITPAYNGTTLTDLAPTSASYNTTASHVLDVQAQFNTASVNIFASGYAYTVTPLN